MTDADELTQLRRERDAALATLVEVQEQIRLTIVDAANLEAERNELAEKLGAEVARSTMYQKAAEAHFASLMSVCDERDRYEKALREIRYLGYDPNGLVSAALSSGGGDGK